MLFAVIAVRQAAADDRSLCYTASGPEAAGLSAVKIDAAIAACSRLIKRNPRDEGAYYARAAGYFQKSDYDRAIADDDEAIRLNPGHADAWADRGDSYSSKGEYDRALVDLNQAIAMNPKNAMSYYSRCFAYTGKGDYDRAIADCSVAIALDPKNAARYTPTLEEARKGRDQGRLNAPKPEQPVVQTSPAPPMPVIQAAPEPGKPLAPVAPVSTSITKRALVIGIDSYPNLGPAAQLERAVADADAVGDKLAALGFQVTRLTSARQGTLDALLRSFADFRKTVAKDDMVVLFYAGHGMGLSDGTYLLPADVQEGSLEVPELARRAAINENELTNGLRERAGIVVAVIDACRNDLFSRAVTRAAGDTRGLRPAETEGIFKLYSASEGQTALDRLPGGDGSKNSVFTRVFLKALDTPGLSLNALGARVRDEVYRTARAASHQQIPAVYDKLIGSTEVYFAGEAAADGRR
jgi:tetratricopeptide (TPR) repeat protein